jgi:CO/xanthine dehydrogenase Mo-binding subunit
MAEITPVCGPAALTTCSQEKSPAAVYGRAKPLHADRPTLAVDRVRHVGDGLAFVVAETMEQANQAAGLVEVDYELLPAYVEPRAGAAEAPIWADPPESKSLAKINVAIHVEPTDS